MKISKFVKFMLAGALVLGMFGLKEVATPQRAEAASTYYCVYGGNPCTYSPSGPSMSFTTDVFNYSKSLSTYVQTDIVIADYETDPYNWNMKIQKLINGTWTNYTAAATKTGYVANYSPSRRTWSINDFSLGQYRVWMQITSDFTGETFSNHVYATNFNVNN